MDIKDLINELKNCRNELCVKCGSYRNSHNGACDGCRYNFENMAKWDTIEERPTGEWLEHWSKELSEKGFYQCSRCKAGFQRYEKGIRHSELPWIDGQKYELHCIDNYCPNCGAYMGGNDNG